MHDPDGDGGATLRACSRCMRVHYCSAEHQKEDWPRHKRAECKDKPKADELASGGAE